MVRQVFIIKKNLVKGNDCMKALVLEIQCEEEALSRREPK